MINLTDKWKKGELPEGWYYIKCEDGQTTIAEYFAYCIDKETNEAEYDWSCCSEPEQIIAPVPSYELWKAIHEQWKALLEENTKLKELLKECRECFEFLTDDNSPWCPPEADTLLVKINQVLGEE